MNTSPQLSEYNQSDVQSLYQSGSIVPNVDSYANLIIQNIENQLYSSSITIPFVNANYNSTKVETKNDPTFYEL